MKKIKAAVPVHVITVFIPKLPKKVYDKAFKALLRYRDKYGIPMLIDAHKEIMAENINIKNFK